MPVQRSLKEGCPGSGCIQPAYFLLVYLKDPAFHQPVEHGRRSGSPLQKFLLGDFFRRFAKQAESSMYFDQQVQLFGSGGAAIRQRRSADGVRCLPLPSGVRGSRSWACRCASVLLSQRPLFIQQGFNYSRIFLMPLSFSSFVMHCSGSAASRSNIFCSFSGSCTSDSKSGLYSTMVSLSSFSPEGSAAL